MVPGDTKAAHQDSSRQERRRAAIVAFLGAGLPSPPARSTLVSALAAARQEVAARRARHLPIEPWLADEIHLRGIKENAAVLAVLTGPL